MIKEFEMMIVSEEDGYYIIEIVDDAIAMLKFNPKEKELVFQSENELTEFLKDNEYQLRKLLHNKRPNSFYVGFKLKFSMIAGKDVAKFNDRNNIVVVDHGEIYVIDKESKKKVIEIYTDGSFNEKREIGAYAILVKELDKSYREEAFISESKSSSLIELEAVIKALELIEGDVRIITDSQYVRKGITEWIVHWKRNNWTTANGTKAKNIDRWKHLEKLCLNRYIELEWVKAHSNHFENDYCDIKSKEMTRGVVMKKKVVAFVCTHNSCRSQMAEGWANHFGSDILEVYSGGTEEYPEVKPKAVEVMKEVGIDIGHHKPKLVTDIPVEVDYLITMGCGVVCPFVANNHEEDWGLDDPSGGPIEGFRVTRDLIKDKVIDFIEQIKNTEK